MKESGAQINAELEQMITAADEADSKETKEKEEEAGNLILAPMVQGAVLATDD